RPVSRARPRARRNPQPGGCRLDGWRPPCPRAPARPTRQASPGAPRTPRREPASPPKLSQSRSLGKLREVGFSFLHVRVSAFPGLFAHVIEESRVARELFVRCGPVVGPVQSRLEHSQRQRAELEHPPAPRK